MATTVLVEFETFVEDLIPRAAEKPQCSSQQSEDAQHKVSKLFNNGCDKDSKPEKPKEIDIAKTIVRCHSPRVLVVINRNTQVGIINELELLKGYKVVLACHPKKARAVAALYPGDKVPSNSKPDWTHSRLFIEFKEGESKYDPWDDSDEMSPESECETAVDVRAQFTTYAHNTFLHQHRTALYSLFILGREFRAVRWDRAGVIVSKKVDYVKHTDSLLEILWRIAQLDDAQQGLDPTATLISVQGSSVPKLRPSERRNLVQAEGRTRSPSSRSVKYGNDRSCRVRHLRRRPPAASVRGGAEAYRVFLVGKPIFVSSSLFGRATRGYVAVDAKTRRFVFLKDSWRPFYEGVDPEGTYLKKLSKDKALLVPAYLCDGDVDAPSAANLAPLETEDSLRHHIHYRIVMKDVCLPFDRFRSSKELVRLIYHCVSTHYWAYTTYNLLHRDISSGNVLILPRYTTVDGKEKVRWFGILTDWELAKTVCKKGTEDKARQPERTGTWQFMSVASVASQWTLPVAVADELESFFHVMLFYGVRY
ncbi:uncharacterized protein TRAVEDRAFT_120707, partial [Trametes versicolor FP-101664 SS1]|uniref:uncharacterized protein n=1 Tax=Trametes versicolor (strain FP-101664) TaxID=717944 RepID=UPI00046244CF